jgi:hypothetical protein
MSRANGGATEDAAVEKTVAPSAPATVVTKEVPAEKTLKPLTKGPKPQQKQPGQSKVYTKHVLFALTIAFVMKLVANGKLGK